MNVIVLVLLCLVSSTTSGWKIKDYEFPNELADLNIRITESSWPSIRNPDHGKILGSLVWSEMSDGWMSIDVQHDYIRGCIKDWCNEPSMLCPVSRHDFIDGRITQNLGFPVAIGVDYNAGLNWVRASVVCEWAKTAALMKGVV